MGIQQVHVIAQLVGQIAMETISYTLNAWKAFGCQVATIAFTQLVTVLTIHVQKELF